MTTSRSAPFLEALSRLQSHDLSAAIVMHSLIAAADTSGALERRLLLARMRARYTELYGESGTQALDAAGRGGDYLSEQVLARLETIGLLERSPAGPEWTAVRVPTVLWSEIQDDRATVVAAIDHAIRQTALGEAGRSTKAGGSTLSARELVKVYRKRRVVDAASISVSQGEIVGLLGPNGAGKTTTFYMMVGLIAPDGGTVHLDQENLTNVPMYQRARRGIGYLSQEPSIFRKMTVEENVMAILETLPLKKADRNARLESLLDELSIKHLRKSKAYSLSGGERRRLEITRALVTEPRFLLLDEPFAGVDPIAVHDIQQIVSGLRARDIGVVISDHNVEQTLDIVDRAYIMYDGGVHISGTVPELVWNEEVAEIYLGPTLTARMRERYGRPTAGNVA